MTIQKEMFGSLELDKKIVTALTDMGFEEPSPIQAATIPLVLEGNDVIGPDRYRQDRCLRYSSGAGNYRLQAYSGADYDSDP